MFVIYYAYDIHIRDIVHLPFESDLSENNYAVFATFQ